ncbi:glycosyl hydrolase family 18 protein [Chitinolyticbacter meiyuanensis]|uniref:glycosyl hydrolase family 18 protein n=1 Tax=Chitinolyticbacter meiyuanensis TaxID=682798 RepID=UPI0011E5E273|nr:glycosyl hydrolase family 18 protein [Chitinolyticbacter meiyuanensis]
MRSGAYILKGIALLAFVLATVGAWAEPIVAGYFASWATYHRPAPFERIPFARLSHLIYAQAAPTADGDVVSTDFVADFNHAYPAERGWPAARGNFARLRQIGAHYPALKLLISVGGWEGSRHWPTVAADPAKRQRFARQLRAFIAQHGFDGAVIDWRYPGTGGIAGMAASTVDGANQLALVEAVRAEFAEQQPRPLLAVTVGGKQDQLSALALPQLVLAADFAIVLAFDYHGAWDRRTGHNAPLSGDGDSVSAAMRTLALRGVPGSRLVLGIDNQGDGWTGVPNSVHGLGQQAQGALLGSWDDEDSGPSGRMDLDEVLALQAAPGTQSHWDDAAQAETLYVPAQSVFVSFESPRALSAKLAEADRRGYAGAALWELSGEFNGDGSLLRQIHTHYTPWAGHWQSVLDAWRERPAWFDPFAGGVVTALLMLLGGHWLREWRTERRQVLAVRDQRAQLWALLPLLRALREQAWLRRIDANASPDWLRWQQQALRVETHLRVLAPPRPILTQASAAIVPEYAVSDIVVANEYTDAPAESLGRLAALNALLAELGEQRSAERMLEVVMQFLANQDAVAAVALLQDGEPVQQLGDGQLAGDPVLPPGVHFNADRTRAWLNADDGSDFQLALAFIAPADGEDEALLLHLAQQIRLVRQHLTELTRQPHVLSELYEIASRRDKLLFIRADKGYSGIHTADGGMPLYVTLRLRAIRLYFPEEVLLQVHRSYLVNPRRVTRAQHVGKGQYELLIGKQAIPVRRQYLARLRELYPQWFVVAS